MTKTVTGLYDTYDAATRTVRDLEAARIPHSDISIVAHRVDEGPYEEEAASGAGVGASAGAAVGGGVGLLTGLGIMAIPGVGPVVAAGWLIATAVGAVAGAAAGGATGGLIGSLTSSGISRDDANVYAEGVRRGGALVTARVQDDLVSVTEEIMQRHGRVDVSERARTYRQTGWNTFDEAAPPLTAEDIARERDRRPTRPIV